VTKVASLPSDTLPPTAEEIALNDIEPMHREGMDLDTSTADAAKDSEKLPSTSVLRDPIEQTSAAFVLNYLRHHGHSTALESTRQEMKKRNWLPADLPPSRNREISDMVHEIVRRTLDLSSVMPLDLIDQYCQNKEILQLASILQLVHLIRQSQARDDDDIEEALSYGKQLRGKSLQDTEADPKSLKWDETPLKWLEEASGYIGLPMTKEQVESWDNRRVDLAVRVEASLRCELFLLFQR
jgi:hypothetical protein